MIKFILAIAALVGAFVGIYHMGVSAEHAKQQIVIGRLTGDLAQANANSRTLQSAIAIQNAAIASRSAQDARTLAAATARLSVAQQRTREAQSVAARLMRPLVMPDTCSRLLEIDRRFMETLK